MAATHVSGLVTGGQSLLQEKHTFREQTVDLPLAAFRGLPVREGCPEEARGPARPPDGVAAVFPPLSLQRRSTGLGIKQTQDGICSPVLLVPPLAPG